MSEEILRGGQGKTVSDVRESGKAIAFMGPLLYGAMTTLFGSQRYGLGAVIVFFVIGGLILATVDEQEGVAASGRVTAA